MKRAMLFGFTLLGIVALIAHRSSAGVPIDQNPQSMGNWYHSVLFVSTNTYNQGVALPQTITSAPGTSNGYTCRNCFTRFFVEISTSANLYILDGGTTDYFIAGNSLGSVNTTVGSAALSLPEDHLGPACFTYGNTTTFTITGSSVPNVSNSLTAEGFVDCRPGNN